MAARKRPSSTFKTSGAEPVSPSAGLSRYTPSVNLLGVLARTTAFAVTPSQSTGPGPNLLVEAHDGCSEADRQWTMLAVHRHSHSKARTLETPNASCSGSSGSGPASRIIALRLVTHGIASAAWASYPFSMGVSDRGADRRGMRATLSSARSPTLGVCF